MNCGFATRLASQPRGPGRPDMNSSVVQQVEPYLDASGLTALPASRGYVDYLVLLERLCDGFVHVTPLIDRTVKPLYQQTFHKGREFSAIAGQWVWLLVESNAAPEAQCIRK